jgi:hypothetical protein
MPKKERIYVTLPKEPALEVEADAPEVEASVAVSEAPEIVACANCGLLRSEFPAAWRGLRPDLQVQNGKKLCPRCFVPVKPY